MGLSDKGFLSTEELKKRGRYPSEERFKKGPVAVIECSQEIPCNPCESSCNFGAIGVGKPITNLPELDEEKCTGCGLCVAACPGLAIFIIDKTFSENLSTVSFPYEYPILPEKGDKVDAVDREGKYVCKGQVTKVITSKTFDKTPVVTISVPDKHIDNVRGMALLRKKGDSKSE
ncbi:MAG: 4Fe-4S binding protein [Bacillota bacterium]